VHSLHEQRWSGTLTLAHMGIGKSIKVQDGRLAFASSTSPDERLGELLLRRGRISFRQYVDAGKAIGPGKRLGTVLVEQGVLEPRELIKWVVEHTQEILYGAFQLTEGHYRLHQGLEQAEAITLRISTPDIIVEGIRRIEAWSRIARGVGSLGARYVRADGYERVARAMTLAPEKTALLDLLATPLEVETVCAASALPDFEICRTLWAFRVIGIVTRVDADEGPPRAVEDEGLGDVLDGDDG
jgi:hypothetical protein